MPGAAVVGTSAWSAASAGARAVAPADSFTLIDHVLDSVAGFFGSAAEAQGAMRQLAATQSLQPSQLLLLAPADATWLSFTVRSRHWASRAQQDNQTWFGDVWLLASVGALLAGLTSAMHLSLEDALAMNLALFIFALATLAGAAGGAFTAWLSRRLPHLEAFASIVRQQLAGGRWALVVHGVPWERQAGSVALLRENSIDWCAVSLVQRTL